MTDPVPLTAEEEAHVRLRVELYGPMVGRLLATLDRDRSTPSVDGLRCAHERDYPGWCYSHDSQWPRTEQVCVAARLAATPTPAGDR